MTTAYVVLGSNVGDRLENLWSAVVRLRERVVVTAISPVYETEPVGYAAQEWFLNCAAAVATDLPPHQLFAVLRQVEEAMGKQTPFPNGPRVIDLDLLLYGGEVVETSSLQVPHPRMHERRFVLVPLADIAADAVHPTLNATVAELLGRLADGGRVRFFAAAS